MGFSKWLFRNEPGSPGHTTRTLVKLYQNSRENLEKESGEEINNAEVYEAVYFSRLYIQQRLNNRHSLLVPFGNKMESIHVQNDMPLFVFAMECLETKQFRVSVGNDNIDDILDVIKE